MDKFKDLLKESRCAVNTNLAASRTEEKHGAREQILDKIIEYIDARAEKN